MIVTATAHLRNEGTVHVFEGHPEDDPDVTVTFGADHRMAYPLALAIAEGEQPECWVEDWQVLGARYITTED